MMQNGMGRSNALPVLQIVLGAALVVLSALSGLRGGHDPWFRWVLAASGAVQVVVGVTTIRRNQRLDHAESSR